MARMAGGMEFAEGAPVRLGSPPGTLPAVPLRVYCSLRPEVVPGQTVKAGQLLTQPRTLGEACQISPVVGTVRQVTPSVRRGRGPGADGRGYELTIEPAGSTVLTMLEEDSPRRQKLEVWFATMRKSGPWPEPGLPFGLIEQLDMARERPPGTVICIGLDAFPPYPDRSSLLVSFPDDAVLGTQILADLVGASNVMMVASRSPKVLARLRRSCRNFRLKLAAMHNVYPLADPTLVAAYVAPGKVRLACGVNPVEQGLLLTTPWTAIRLARWFTLGKLDLVRPVFIGWPTPGTPLKPAWVMPGQPLASLDSALAGSAARLAERAVFGHPMTGRPITAPSDGEMPLPPVLPEDELLVSVLSWPGRSLAEPCIGCGWCVQVCPTRLMPIDLAQAVLRNPHDDVAAEQLPWCVQCGLCSHVCPSRLPLTQVLRTAARNAGGE